MRSDIRYEVTSSSTVQAYVKRAEDVRQESAEVLLLDLSRRGAKLGTDYALPVHSRLAIRLVVEAIGLEAHLVATVCWARPVGSDQWWIGCAFESPLPEKDIAQLAAGGFIERRKNSRHPYDLPATIRWETDPRRVPVVLTDVSSGGFGILSQEKPNVGDRILLALELDNPRENPLLARVQWCRRVSDGYQSGCAYLERDAYAETQRRIARRNPVESGGEMVSRRKRRWLFFLTGIMLCGLAMCWGLS